MFLQGGAAILGSDNDIDDAGEDERNPEWIGDEKPVDDDDIRWVTPNLGKSGCVSV